MWPQKHCSGMNQLSRDNNPIFQETMRCFIKLSRALELSHGGSKCSACSRIPIRRQRGVQTNLMV